MSAAGDACCELPVVSAQVKGDGSGEGANGGVEQTEHGGLRRGLWPSLGDHFADFCENTSIHGLKYVGEKRRPWLERVAWAAALAASLGACAVLMSRAWRRWQDSPVIVAMDENLRPVWQLPFPAVTVCPETKISSAHFKYSDVHKRAREKKITRQEYYNLSLSTLLCDPHVFKSGEKILLPEVVDFLEKVTLSVDSTIFFAKWSGKLQQRRMDLFQPLMTEEGLCFSFNMLHYSELFSSDSFQATGRYLNYSRRTAEMWNLDEGYHASAGVDTYPQRSLGAGAVLSLTVVLRIFTSDLDYICKGPSQGFRVQLHNPAEFPRVAQQYFRTGLDSDVTVGVSPSVVATSPELRAYRPEERGCFFTGERKLRFFRVYTQQNCALECLANYTLSRCNCSAHYMPRARDTLVCGMGSAQCVRDARDDLLLHQVAGGLQKDTEGDQCGCLLSCSSLSYESERSQSSYEWRRLLENNGENPESYKGWNLTRLSIFFRDGNFIASRRSELYGNTDFLANCGGLLGLGLGISVLSLVELLYWILLRLCCRRPA